MNQSDQSSGASSANTVVEADDASAEQLASSNIDEEEQINNNEDLEAGRPGRRGLEVNESSEEPFATRDRNAALAAEQELNNFKNKEDDTSPPHQSSSTPLCPPHPEVNNSPGESLATRDLNAALAVEQELSTKGKNEEPDDREVEGEAAGTASSATADSPPSANQDVRGEEGRAQGSNDVPQVPYAPPDFVPASRHLIRPPVQSPSPPARSVTGQQLPTAPVDIEVEATLVTSQRMLSPHHDTPPSLAQHPIVAAAPLPPQHPIIDAVPLMLLRQPWWRRHKVVLLVGIVGLIIGVVATISGAMVISARGNNSSSNESESPTSTSTATLSTVASNANTPTLSIQDGTTATSTTTTRTTTAATASSTTASTETTPSKTTTTEQTPTPLLVAAQDECLSFVGSAFETRCSYRCSPHIGMDGDTAVVARDYFDIRFYSFSSDFLEVVSEINIDYDVGNVAVSGDVAAVGASSEDRDDGAVYLYEEISAGKWDQTIRISPPSDIVGQGALFGDSVSVDNDVLVVGAPYDSTDGVHGGSAFIYRQTGSAWELEQSLIPDPSIAEQFGYSVSVRGNVVVVGDWNYVHVYNFNSTSNSWVQLGEPFTNDDCVNSFGAYVELTDGNGLAIGCDEENDAGAVFYYEQSGYAEEYMFRQKLKASDGAPGDDFGGWQKISVDGDVMVVGTDQETNGKAYVFRRVDGEWVEVAIINAPSDSVFYYGWRVATSDNRILIYSTTNVYAYTLGECA